MTKVICFGDSNTFGWDPKDGSRYNFETRWTGILTTLLDKEFIVVEEGCNDRTGFFPNSKGKLQSGQFYLPECLKKHKYFDIFILALGTNDLKKIFNLNENIVKDGLKNFVTQIREINKQVRIIIIPPVILSEKVVEVYGCQFDEKSVKSSVWIQKIYKEFSEEENCEYLDLNKYVYPSGLDGIHFDKSAHKIIAEKIANQILIQVCN